MKVRLAWAMLFLVAGWFAFPNVREFYQLSRWFPLIESSTEATWWLIGLIILAGIVVNNAILMVEYIEQIEREGQARWPAIIEGAAVRLRPILMTSLAFVMGVLPLVLSSGAGSEMRHAMGVAVFAGMIGVTAFGLFLTPVFYVVLRRLTGNRPLKQHGQAPHTDAAALGGGGSALPLPAAPRHANEP